jgi:uncharacterized membrane protein
MVSASAFLCSFVAALLSVVYTRNCAEAVEQQVSECKFDIAALLIGNALLYRRVQQAC